MDFIYHYIFLASVRLRIHRSSTCIQDLQYFSCFNQLGEEPLEENEIVGITNYIDFGFEMQTRYIILSNKLEQDQMVLSNVHIKL